MSSYENVVGGKLKLKGKALDVKTGGVKKKKKTKKLQNQDSIVMEDDVVAGGSTELTSKPDEEEEMNESNKSSGGGKAVSFEDYLTPAERRYLEQREQLDVNRLAKTANKSHRDRIQDFNQYLANMSEHYDIPKVGPG